ncbi:MAG: hypothetical protein QOE07_1018 [Acidimicrobiaceae bacterium]|jgi:hypothetical protein|nr:hypothetical protein [Acidimicrobiaceae bacterium]
MAALALPTVDAMLAIVVVRPTARRRQVPGAELTSVLGHLPGSAKWQVCSGLNWRTQRHLSLSSTPTRRGAEH